MLRSLKGLYHLLIAIASTVWFRFPSRQLTVVGITGTDGKTTTTSLVYDIAVQAGIKASMITSVHAVIAGKSYDTGFHVTTPSAWWVQKYMREAVDHGDTHMILEVTSHGLAQHRVWGVRFAVGVLTNVTHEHLDWHGSFQKYLQTKLLLLKRSNVAVVNRDEDLIYEDVMKAIPNRKLITYGIRRDARITPQTFPFKTQLLGIYNQYNCLAAIAATKALNIPDAAIRKSISKFSGVVGRMEILQKKPFMVVVDFAHTPNALENILRTIKSMTSGKIIHVFGSAGLRDRTKRPIMGKISGTYADNSILTEEDYRTENLQHIMTDIEKGFENSSTVLRIENRGNAIRKALQLASPGDCVIITGKGHEKSLCRGKKEYPWSDQKVVRAELRKL